MVCVNLPILKQAENFKVKGIGVDKYLKTELEKLQGITSYHFLKFLKIN